MRVGDLLEWLAAACLVAGAFFATDLLWPPLLAAGVCLAYFAQCHAHQVIPKPRIQWSRRSRP